MSISLSLRSKSELCFSVGRLIDLAMLRCRASRRQFLIWGWAKKYAKLVQSCVKGVLFDHGQKWKKSQTPPSRNSNLLFQLWFFSFVSNSLLYIAIPQNKGKLNLNQRWNWNSKGRKVFYLNSKPYEIVYSARQIYLTFYFRSKKQEETCCNSFMCKVEPLPKCFKMKLMDSVCIDPADNWVADTYSGHRAKLSKRNPLTAWPILIWNDIKFRCWELTQLAEDKKLAEDKTTGWRQNNWLMTKQLVEDKTTSWR